MKKALIWFLVFFFVLVLASVAIAFFFEKQIGQQLITAINKELVDDIKVEEFELSLLKGFPNVSARLNQVQVPDNRGGVLLEAESMSFNIGLIGLLTSNLKFGSVLVENGALFVDIDRRGKANYFISKPAANEAAASGGSDFSLSLKEAILNNIELIYVNRQTVQELKWLLQDAQFSGEFDSDKFSMVSEAAIESHFVDSEEERYLVGQPLGYTANIYVDLNENLYELQDVTLRLDDNEFDVKGTVHQLKSATDFDLTIHTNDGNLESVIQLLPQDYQYLEGFSSSGNFNFDILVNGKLNDKEQPAVKFNFGLAEGSIQHTELGSSIKDVSFAASFTNGEAPAGRDAIFEVQNFKGYFNRELIESRLKVTNLENPKIQLDLDGTLPVESIFPMFGYASITDGDGEMEFRNVHLDGRYEDMIRTSRIHKVNASGMIELDDAEVTINKETLVFDKGLITLQDNQIQINKVEMEGAGSDLIFEGYFHNMIPVLLADSINSKEAELKFSASLKAEELDLDRLLIATELKIDEELVAKGGDVDSLKSEKVEQREFITNFLNGTFAAEIESFNYNKVEGENFKGKLEFKNNQMSIVGEAGAMGGSFDIDGTTTFEERPKLKAKVISNDIDAKEFFRQMEDFGQEVLSYKNLDGTLNSKMVVSAEWDKEGEFDYDALKVLADVSATDGELNNFGMLEEFSDYVKIRDLRSIRFVDMRNWFEIKNQTLHIPAMLIQTNAMNMLLSGEHTFENRFDYSMKINAGQVLFSKFKKHNPDLKPQPAKTNGLFNLHYNVYGDFDDYQVKTNKRKVKDAFKMSEYRKNSIKAALDKEFGRAYRMEIPAAYDEKFKDIIIDLGGFDEGQIRYLDPIVGKKKGS